jgi:c(7)-type cytochrome triheme protein
MKISIPVIALTAFLLLLGFFAASALYAQNVPAKLTFAAKNGNVTFDHTAHVKRANGDCAGCHDKLFKQDSKVALNYKAGMHRPAEAAKTSCGACHVAGGPAFESKANCAKCHIKG